MHGDEPGDHVRKQEVACVGEGDARGLVDHHAP